VPNSWNFEETACRGHSIEKESRTIYETTKKHQFRSTINLPRLQIDDKAINKRVPAAENIKE
jgi:hypothetical protein